MTVRSMGQWASRSFVSTPRVIAALTMVLAAAIASSRAAAAPQTNAASVDWRTRGSDRLAAGDTAGAIDAWNHAGLPVVSRVTVSGAMLTDESAILRLIDIPEHQLLTRDAWDRAVRRLRELPAASATIVCETQAPDQVAVTVTLDEDSTFPTDFFGLSAVAGRAIVQRDIQVPVRNLAHDGDVLLTAFRWPADWRRALIDFSAPSPHPLPGLMDIQASWERQTYRLSDSGDIPDAREDHLQFQAGWSDWFGGRARWLAAVSFDQWNDRRHAGLVGNIDLRGLRDRFSIGVEVGVWPRQRGDAGFDRVDAWTALRTTTVDRAPKIVTFVEALSTSAGAPFDFWSGAGNGLGRPSLLRAHTVLDGDVIGGPTFGRTLVHTTTEYQQPLSVIYGTTLSLAGFVDAARVWQRADGSHSPILVDAGFGLRWTAPGLGSVIRLDAAHSLRDGSYAFSAGWVPAWPR